MFTITPLKCFSVATIAYEILSLTNLLSNKLISYEFSISFANISSMLIYL